MEPLDAFVLCGGLGTRLRPVIDDRPKPIAPVYGRPFLDLLLAHFAAQGLARFVLCTGYRAESIAALADRLGEHGEVIVSPESEPLGTAGALRDALGHRNHDTVLAMNGDSFAAVDVAALLRVHRERAARFTVAVVPASEGEEGGAIRLEADGRIRSFEEKRPLRAGDYLNAGIYIVEAEVLLGDPRSAPLSLEVDVMPELIGDRFYAFVHPGPLVDIGTPERYAAAEEHLAAAGLDVLPGGPASVGSRPDSGPARS